MADQKQVDARVSNKKAFQKTPKVYVSVGKYLQQLDEKTTSLRSIVNSPKNTSHDVKFVLPLLRNIVRFRHVIDRLIAETPLKDAKNVNAFLLRVAVYEQTFHGRELCGSSQAIQCVKEHRQALDQALTDYLAAQQLPDLTALIAQTHINQFKLPIYVRVNTIKTTTGDVLQTLSDDGFELVEYDDSISYESYKELVFSLELYQFVRELHILDMFVFNFRSGVAKSQIVADGFVVLQNKSSCFTPLLLNPPPDSVVLDACAAPGMKTTYLAALMKNDGILLANDMSESRAEQMRSILSNTGATCAKVIVKDFTSINPTEKPYCDVQYILLDPSCSGTGIVNRDLTSNAEDTEMLSKNRLVALSTMQNRLLCHALKFPKVERIVYSTCSIHCEENEDVVRFALNRFSDTFELEEPPPFPFRTTNKSFLKFSSEKDLTNGFFVAILQRKESTEPKSNDAVYEELSGENTAATERPQKKKDKKNKRKHTPSDEDQLDTDVIAKKPKKKKSK